MNRKIRVLVITNSFPTVHNKWAAVFILNQLEYLKKTCEFKVINPYAYVPKIRFFNPFYKFSQIPFKDKISGIEVYRPRYVQISRFFLFNSLLRSMAVLIESVNIYLNTASVIKDLEAKWKFDLIHLHGPISEGLLGVYAKKNMINL